MGGDFFSRGMRGGGGVALILSLCEGGGVEINFCLMREGEYDLVLGHISNISQPSPPPPDPWVGRCGAAPHTLTLFKTNIADFPTLFKTEFRFLIPCLRHLSCLRQKLINRYPD